MGPALNGQFSGQAGVHSRLQALVLAAQHGLVTPEQGGKARFSPPAPGTTRDACPYKAQMKTPRRVGTIAS
jgi:hypothetical protein